MAGVSGLNSCGVRAWFSFIRQLSSAATVELVRCSPAIVYQLNVLSNFSASADITSVEAPFRCPSCKTQLTRTYEIDPRHPPSLGAVACPSCGKTMDFDGPIENYFDFVAKRH